jgi:hypothetical protein
MGDEAQTHRAAEADQVLSRGAVTGWDPYEVWSTRIRPLQRSIEPASAQSAALQRRARAARVLFRFHWRSS